MQKDKAMEKEFEKYLAQNRDKLETGGPSPRVWQNLEAELIQRNQKTARIIKMRRIWLSAAASLLLLIGLGALLFKKDKSVIRAAKTINIKTNTDTAKTTPQLLVNTVKPGKAIQKKEDGDFDLTDKEYRQTIYYYTRLVEIRQRQIGRIQNADPELYKESRTAIEELDAVYSRLKTQLPNSINQEKVLESMIENLQMQEKILNNQLQLIRELQSNKNDHDKPGKEI